MSYNRAGAPRNTSNGEYGKFHFASNMASNGQMQQNTFYSTNGQRMTQHVHYPNCPNRNSQNQFQGAGDGNAMQDYTIEYGEDAVRAALGGQMPDFQAQFQKQYGGNTDGATGGSSPNVVPQAVKMMNNGKSKIAMIPVVLATEGEGNQQEDNEGNPDNETTTGGTDIPPRTQPNNCQPTPQSLPQAQTTNVCVEQAAQAAGTTASSRQENITNAFESARRARSSGQVKFGRHIRPSYWKPETPNPCRKKMVGGAGDVCDTPNNSQDDNSTQACNSPYVMGNGSEMLMNENGYFAPPQPPMISPNAQQMTSMDYHQRTRSLPPKKAVGKNYSLCGKCKKCKNLRSETSEASVLTFPKYSTGVFQRQSQKPTSSNLGQSAKNFRAIRFSSHHM